MSRSNFTEGFILGAVIGAVATYFLTDQDVTKKVKDDKRVKETIKSTKETTEAAVAKTLEAIEKGFDKITTMVDKKKVGTNGTRK